ncbi:MAG TPA: globin [Chloroflexota bacterium]|jgi:hemoglobin|nr:globin [Chloroflexota bacterium]
MSEPPARADVDARTIYEAAGGAETFHRLVDRFYEGVAGDPVLRPLYPDDLSTSRRHLALFLMQYFGGPATYSGERGHPRLRMRHLPFPIGQAQRDAWMRHMRDAVESAELPEPVSAALLDYFERAATFLMNRDS